MANTINYDPEEQKQKAINILRWVADLIEDNQSSITELEASLPMVGSGLLGWESSSNFSLSMAGKVALPPPVYVVETPKEPKEVIWKTEKVDSVYLVEIATSTIQAEDVESVGYSDESGVQYEFHCPVCGDKLHTAECGWWKTKCLCGYTWNTGGEGTMQKYTYSDDTVEMVG